VNIWALRALLFQQSLQRILMPVDNTIWQMTASTVNAYYDPTLNTINFPAGIIQQPFFNASWPMAANFGGIGMVMGHELTHGFDDQGCQYNGTGELVNWWPQSVVDQFKNRTRCIAEQYSKFLVPYSSNEGDYVNGNLTLGENIADNGGIHLAHNAYQAYFAKKQAEPLPPTNPPISGDQFFFLSFAQNWCSLIRPQTAAQLLRTDVHSPPFARVNGPLQNLQAFADAYQCPSGSPMNPEKKCLLW